MGTQLNKIRKRKGGAAVITGLAGIAMAWGFRKKDIQPRKRYQWEDEPEQEPQDESAPWNYRQNWPGSSNYYVPGESNRMIRLRNKPQSHRRRCFVHPRCRLPTIRSRAQSAFRTLLVQLAYGVVARSR